ncbi:hypothetical protein CLIM01_08508 [Colletotrichum limetticola]|uniref:Uncharacterized protein n=1 Tax=Colletotrichum limetticola TaxID=1209924 RepID=A0ABQ9PRI8_9PEZI|nr:hypothetical protein CLIM01_08508 [Colletotrichum limetticola]
MATSPACGGQAKRVRQDSPDAAKKAHGPETPQGVRVCERRRPQAAAWDVWAIPRRQALSALGQDRRQWTRGGGQSFFSGVR